MRNTTILILALIVSACIVSSNAMATPDLNAPAWRGEEGTTFQLWEFAENTNPSDSDAEPGANPYGIPTATIIHTKPFVPWIPMDHGHQGVWYVEQSDWVTLHVPSSQTSDPVKQLYLQMIYYTAVADDAVFTVAPETADVELLHTAIIDEYYRYGAFLITLTGADATLEDLMLKPQGCTLYIDSIAVDTIPEPITLALFGLGSLMIGARRKKLNRPPTTA